MSTELRIYQIKDGKLDEWLSRWRAEIAPLLEQFGFHIGGAWSVDERNQFVYFLAYDGPGDFESRNQEYATSPERVALGIDPADYIDSIEKFALSPI